MRSRYLLLALLIGLGVALLGSLPSPAGETVSGEKIDKLIEQMGSGTFAERQKASKELDAIGAPALKALRKAAKSEDAEIRKRAEELVKKIEKQAESATILAPKRIHLVYKDTPVSEAVADFQKKSGYTIHLHDPQGKLKERKITLDTGETSFWHAYALFCDKAGLAEATMQDMMQAPVGIPGGAPAPIGVPGGAPVPIRKPPVRKLPPQPVPDPVPVPPGKGGALAVETPPPPAPPPGAKPIPPQPAVPAPGIALQGRVMPFMPGTPGMIMLKDAKPKKLPTDDRSAVRVRALSKADMFGAAPEGEIMLALEVTPEPKLQWQGMQSIHINKALDDQDQKLSQIVPQIPAGPGFRGGAGGFAPPQAVIRPAIMRPGMGGFWGGPNQPIPVQLKKGEKAAKSLKELTGVITANVLSETKPMITADKLDKAAGKTFKGDEGGSIKIIEVKTDEAKKTTIQFELEQPPNVIAAMPQNMGMMGMPGVGAIMPAPPVRIKIRPPGAGAPPAPRRLPPRRRQPPSAGCCASRCRYRSVGQEAASSCSLLSDRAAASLDPSTASAFRMTRATPCRFRWGLSKSA